MSMDGLDGLAAFFARTPWSQSKLSETCSRAIILSSAWCFCCSSTFKATHEKHGAKYLQSWLGNNIQVHHSWKKTTAHQLYSHSGYHIIQDPIKTSSTSIQLTCIFWPQYPTLPHKTSKILLVLSSSRRSLSFSPLSSADLPKWVKPGKPWKPRIQGRPPEVWDKNQELRPLVSCQNVGQTKGFEVLMCFIRSKKKHTHTHLYKSEIVVETYFYGKKSFSFSEASFTRQTWDLVPSAVAGSEPQTSKWEVCWWQWRPIVPLTKVSKGHQQEAGRPTGNAANIERLGELSDFFFETPKISFCENHLVQLQ